MLTVLQEIDDSHKIIKHKKEKISYKQKSQHKKKRIYKKP